MPNVLWVKRLHVKAAMGAVMNPAMDRARAMSQRRFSGPIRANS